ncbi:MAG: hypothetical protein M3R36_12805 [Bacteroidota bacterium]|nr:hypothetical protein [Bacteroidota bacterium]
MKTDSLYISNTGMIGRLKLYLALNHTKITDLEVILLTPSGDSVSKGRVWEGSLIEFLLIIAE